MDYKTQNNYEKSLRFLSEKNINKIPIDEKLNYAQNIENYNAALEGRIPANVTYATLDADTCGLCVDNDIILSKDLLENGSAEQLIKTIYHEGSRSHIGLNQAELVSSIKDRMNFSDQEIRDYNLSYETTGYLNHPAEIEARFEEELKATEFFRNQEEILSSSKSEVQNQILETYEDNQYEWDYSNDEAHALSNENNIEEIEESEVQETEETVENTYDLF